MIIAHVVVLLLALLAGLLALKSPRSEMLPIVIDRRGVLLASSDHPPSESGSIVPGPAVSPRRPVPTEGFLGLVRLSAAPDTFPGPEIDLSGSTYSPSSLDYGSPFTPGDELENGGNGSGGNGSSVFLADPSSSPKPASNLDIAVVTQVDPEYPFVAREAGKQGKASILVYVDTDGVVGPYPAGTTSSRYKIRTNCFTVDSKSRLYDYVIADEFPRHWFFAENLLKVLPQWRFRPRIISGQPTGNYLLITYHFCLGFDCLAVKLQVLGKGLE